MCTFEFEHETGILNYEAAIKQQKEDFKDKQVYRCPYGSDTEKPLALKKDEMIEYLVSECPNFPLECNECKCSYKRCDFYDIEKHDCIKNLLEQVTEMNK